MTSGPAAKPPPLENGAESPRVKWARNRREGRGFAAPEVTSGFRLAASMLTAVPARPSGLGL